MGTRQRTVPRGTARRRPCDLRRRHRRSHCWNRKGPRPPVVPRPPRHRGLCRRTSHRADLQRNRRQQLSGTAHRRRESRSARGGRRRHGQGVPRISDEDLFRLRRPLLPHGRRRRKGQLHRCPRNHQPDLGRKTCPRRHHPDGVRRLLRRCPHVQGPGDPHRRSQFADPGPRSRPRRANAPATPAATRLLPS